MFSNIIIEEHENHSKKYIHKHTSSQKIHLIHQHLDPMSMYFFAFLLFDMKLHNNTFYCCM